VVRLSGDGTAVERQNPVNAPDPGSAQCELDDQLKERAQQQKQTRQALPAEIDSLKRQHQALLQPLTLQKIRAASEIPPGKALNGLVVQVGRELGLTAELC
jgi:hypothetical protein